MIGRICLGLSLPLLLGAAQNDVPESWKPIAPPESGFKAAMPAEPTKKTQQVKTATGQLSVTLFVAEGKNNAVFVVSYTDYPEADLKKGPIEKRLDHARDGAVTSTGGKLRSEQAIKLKGHAGRELVVEKNGEAIARMRIFFAKGRLYQVMVLGPAPGKDVGIFLGSFDLIE